MKGLGSGSRIADRYVLESVIAKGGMGAVYKAIDEKMGRTVAIKVLLAELAEDETSIARFEREASASARLTHPAVVQVFDFGKQDGASYIVMEHVVGRTLATELDQQRKIEPHRACDLIEQALAGIGAAHAEGIVHRDLKPGNVMIIPTGTGREVVKVLDFGIAQLKESKPYARLTKSGAVLGTPTFMSPEQARGEMVDPRTDIYAMGVVLWCCLTGVRPFQGPDVPTTLGKVLSEMPPRADKLDPSIPPAIAHACERAMEKKPSARYATAAEFAQALAEAREQSGIPATSGISMPPEPPEDVGGGVTREMPMAPVMQSHAVSAPPAPPIPPTVDGAPIPRAVSAAPPPAAPAWQRWALLVVGLALFGGVVLGGLIVLGVFELETGAVGLHGVPTTLPTELPTLPTTAPALAPLPPPSSLAPVVTVAPSQGEAAPPVVVPAQGGDACARLTTCCTAFRANVDDRFTDCDTLVDGLGHDAQRCQDEIVVLQQTAGQQGDRIVPPECL